MTINDIMIRDMLDDETEARDREMAEYGREIRRRVWRRRAKAVAEVAGYMAFLALLAAICWLCCAASGYHWE